MPLKLLMSWGAISGEPWGQIGFLSWVSSAVLAFGSKKLGSGFSLILQGCGFFGTQIAT